MTDFSPLDISDEPRGFSVDEIIERNSAPEHVPEMFGGPHGYAIESVEALVREKHQRATDTIADLVKQRSEINELIKGVRQDEAILASAVHRYDRLAETEHDTEELIEQISLEGNEEWE